MLEEGKSGLQYAFTVVYGPCNRKERKRLWKERAAVGGIIEQPWAIGGGFNVIRFEEEKTGRARNTRAMRDFSKFIVDLSLIDPPLHGGSYTWFRGFIEQTASRIDRFLLSQGWDEHFRAIKQRVLPRTTSDHCPILLECGNWDKGKGYFKFENMWFEHKDFSGLIDFWWKSYDIQGGPDVILAKKTELVEGRY